jgi:tRNA A-37 threonylcarbamoyl transferase component Bud32
MANMRTAPRHESETTISPRESESRTMPTPSETRRVFDRGLDTSGGTGFVRERLALFAKTVFLLSFGFYWFMLASIVLVGGGSFAAMWRAPVSLGHLCASSSMGLVWLLASRPTISLTMLGVLDAFSVVVPGVFLAVMTMDDERQVLQAVAAVTVTVMTRAIFVPSRPRRTMLLSALAFVPTIFVCIARHHPTDLVPGFTPAYQKMHLVLETVLWSVLGTTLTTVTSRVIYGLRQQVAEVTELGQYILEEKIGAGGMGEVWRARHRLLIRPAAIKLIRQQVLASMSADHELLMRRFEREARATAALKSPHTVQLYDFGATEDGTLYYVMELLEGLDLDTLVKRHGPLPAERVIHILRQACSSLADAHTNGLVHRDIKPANIVVSRIGTTFDFVKVLDFGLVKLDSAQRADENAVKLTADGRTSGTPAFMAPEVVLGTGETDHRVDIYSLGCVAYWLLTGKLVFEGETPMQVMVHHARTPAPRPSSRVELSITTELEELVMQCLEKDPARRPTSAEVLGAGLEAVAVTPWSAERAEQWWASHRPVAPDARPVADILLSHEGRQMRIGPRARPRG